MKSQPSTETTASVSCRCCGAVLPTLELAQRIDRVPGNEHAKRALEVALTGGFSITFTSVGASYCDALALAQLARQHGITAYCMRPCPCGNHGDSYRACVCRPAVITRYLARAQFRNALQADLHMQVVTRQDQRLGQRQRAEPDEQILARVSEAKQRQTVAIEVRDAATDRLMTAAIRQLDLSTAAVQRTFRIASVIAGMARSNTIGAAHLAEALQYRYR
jgi:predicted ATPase with chaperone activity